MIRMEVPMRVAFICTHNSCRSQIAEAFGRHLAADVFESYSGGTTIKDRINPDAVRLITVCHMKPLSFMGTARKLPGDFHGQRPANGLLTAKIS